MLLLTSSCIKSEVHTTIQIEEDGSDLFDGLAPARGVCAVLLVSLKIALKGEVVFHLKIK